MRALMMLGALLALGIAGCAPNDDDWVRLFNGETLDGWVARGQPDDVAAGYWRVEDGAIVCDATERPGHDYVWLVSEGTFENFELRLEFQAFRDSPGNSGVQVRSRYDAGPDAPRGGWMDGPQIDIHPPTPWRTGLIYDETREERRWIAPDLPDWNIDSTHAPADWTFVYADEGDGWNDLRIRCEGNRIRTWLNDLPVVDFDGSGVLDNPAHRAHDVGLDGRIALQLHSDDALRIRFRDIRVWPL